MVGPGTQTQDLSDESLAPYRSELSGQPEAFGGTANKENKIPMQRTLDLLHQFLGEIN